jgi:Zn-dependent protease
MPALHPQLVVLGFVWFAAFLFSTTCHEAAHALAAKIGGDPTAFHGGQVTLNPIPHMQREPFGMILVPVLSFVLTGGGWMMGWASAPYDPDWQRRHPRRAAWMSLAGPAANFTLMLLAGAAIRLGIAAGQFRAPSTASFTHITESVATGGSSFGTTFLSILFVLNLLLGTFNLIPVPPLDGSTGITVFLSEGRALRYLDWLREFNFGFLGLMIAWIVFDKVFDLVFTVALNALYPGMHYGR